MPGDQPSGGLAEWQLLAGCSHLAHIELPDTDLTTVTAFLERLASN